MTSLSVITRKETLRDREIKSHSYLGREEDLNLGQLVPKLGAFPQSSQPGAKSEGGGILGGPKQQGTRGPQIQAQGGLRGFLGDLVPPQGSLLLPKAERTLAFRQLG